MNTTPIYYHSGTYAKEHNELDKYRETSALCRKCCDGIQAILSARFDGMHLNHEAITDALAAYDPELLGLVLSSTVIYKEWDGRFSRSNKAWAYTIKQLDREAGSFLPTVVNTHPAILDGFITMYRKATA